MTRFNGLSNEHEEILDIVQEECSEIIQAICKVRRHGYSSHHPQRSETNLDDMIRELGDLTCILDIWKRSMGTGGQHIIDAQIKAAALEKLQTLPRYTHHIDWTKY